MMIIHAAKPLFAWDCLEDSPSLQTIKDLLAALPDAKLLDSLRTARGKGRNDYPVTVLWGVDRACGSPRGISPPRPCSPNCAATKDSAGSSASSRRPACPRSGTCRGSRTSLGQEPHRTLLKEIFNVLIRRLGVAVADLGRDTAGDATALSARRKPEEAAQEEIDEGLPQASPAAARSTRTTTAR